MSARLFVFASDYGRPSFCLRTAKTCTAWKNMQKTRHKNILKMKKAIKEPARAAAANDCGRCTSGMTPKGERLTKRQKMKEVHDFRVERINFFSFRFHLLTSTSTSKRSILTASIHFHLALPPNQIASLTLLVTSTLMGPR